MSNKFLKTYKKEFNKSNCGFDHDPVDCIVRSQWQSRSRSHLFLFYRWALVIFTVATVIVSFVSHIQRASFGIYFIYLTRWGILMNMSVAIFGAVLVTCWHFHGNFKDNVTNATKMPTTFKVYWAMHNIALITAFCITIVYWTILHNDKFGVDAANLLTHGTNSLLMFVDVLIVSYPMRLYHFAQPMVFGLIYGMFSLIYYLCGGVDYAGNPFIYPVLDWRKPDKAIITTIGTLILVVILHSVLFWVYKLRVFVQRRYFTNAATLPITTSWRQRLSTIGSKRVSMVFGQADDKGHINPAFKSES